MENFRDLYLDELMDVYDAEQQLVKALPRMAEAASSTQLRTAFVSHLSETEGHVKRIEQVFTNLGTKPEAKTCNAMKGLVKEGSEMIDEDGEGALKDAGLIGAAQRVEHYEIAAYGTLVAFAKQLGDVKGEELLQQTLKEESAADVKLSEIALSVNENAYNQAEAQV